ncbi:MAG: GIY-YIG nuclease family protein [Bacteroidales bacterium]|nr:GIY-YIG nuclease family protein [Bacteroidales bacterium]
MDKGGFVYIMTNKNKTTLYIGVTNDVCRRVFEHIKHLYHNSFTDKYNLEYCIYFEEFPDIESAIAREKELKKWNRKKKETLITQKNPNWDCIIDEKGFIRK